jgi:hypothetical protein
MDWLIVLIEDVNLIVAEIVADPLAYVLGHPELVAFAGLYHRIVPDRYAFLLGRHSVQDAGQA